jgi:hypothetical protein
MKTLSSSLTFFYKYIFITLWSGMFGLGTLTMFQSTDSTLPKYPFLIGWIIGTLFLYIITGRIKKVQTDGRKLFISNYLKSVEVDINQVLSVSGSVMVNPELVWFKLRQTTELGQTIILMPPVRFSFGFTKHPMVQEIQVLIDNRHKF